MTDNASRIAIVVGASSGIGHALVAEYLQRGFRVAALARRAEPLESLAAQAGHDSVLAIAHDVCDGDAIPGIIERIESHFGVPTDTLVLAAGIMPPSDADTWDLASDREVVEVNLLGMMNWIHRIAPAMKERGRGHIVGISSIAGDRGRRDFLAYNTSKAAFTTMLEAVRNRLHRHGVTVTTIKPGFVGTRMTEGKDGLFWVASPEKAASLIARAAESGAMTRYVLRRWWIIGTIVKLLPSFIFRRLNF